MLKLRLSDIPPYNGEYDCDLSYFTMRELHTIKRIANVRAGEIPDALDAADTDLIVAIAVIALERNGISGAEDALWNAQAGQVVLVAEEAAEEVPLELGDQTSSGVSSTPGSAPQVNPPSSTGGQPSDTSATSGRGTLAA